MEQGFPGHDEIAPINNTVDLNRNPRVGQSDVDSGMLDPKGEIIENEEKVAHQIGREAVVGSLSIAENSDREDNSKGQLQPKPKTSDTSSRQRRRGHPMKQVKAQLAEQGKLNAKPPMPAAQKRARRRKKKK